VHCNNALDEWHTPKAENDLRVNGSFCSRMGAKDGTASYDFTGRYAAVKKHKLMAYVITNGRVVSISFAPDKDAIKNNGAL